jgi:glycogen(starch) synthase
MRILMTTDTVGGVWTYAIELAQSLSDAGVEVMLVTMGQLPSTAQRREARKVSGLKLYETSYRLPWMEHPWEDIRAAGDWLLNLAVRLGPHVIHLNEPVYAALDWDAPVIAVGHSCVLSWWQAVLNTPAPDTWHRYQIAMNRGLSRADEVVAPSAWMLQQLRRHYGVQHGRVIPNGRGGSGFDPIAKQPIVFAAGRVWDPAKNLMALEPVAAGLEWPVYIAGEPQHPTEDRKEEAENLHLLGRLSSTEVTDWLRRSSIYAFPARYEPFGLSVLEAALAGNALVLGDLPTLREQWDGRAIFVAPDEPDTLKLAIQSLIDHPDLRSTLAMRARRHAMTLTPQRMGKAYVALYSELLTQRKGSPGVVACAS